MMPTVGMRHVFVMQCSSVVYDNAALARHGITSPGLGPGYGMVGSMVVSRIDRS